jgi:hypothetical protein
VDEDDEADQAAVDRDMEMLIEQQEDDEEEDGMGESPGMEVDIPGHGGLGSARIGGTGGKMDVNHLLAAQMDKEKDGGDGDHQGGGKGRSIYDTSFDGTV